MDELKSSSRGCSGECVCCCAVDIGIDHRFILRVLGCLTLASLLMLVGLAIHQAYSGSPERCIADEASKTSARLDQIPGYQKLRDVSPSGLEKLMTTVAFCRTI